MKQLKTKNCGNCGGTGAVPADDTGPLLRKERERAGLTRTGVADSMGVSDTYLSDLETARRPWTQELVDKYTAALSALVAV